MSRQRSSRPESRHSLMRAALQAKRAGSRWLGLAMALGAVALAVAIVTSLSNRATPPAIDTGGLEPAIAGVVEQALLEVRTDPKSADAWGRLGATLMHYEFSRETGDAFDMAERLAPSIALWPYLHAIALMNHDPTNALAKLRWSAQLSENGPDMPRLRLARFLLERGLPNEAETEFQRLLDEKPNHPAASVGLARILQQRGRHADGIRIVQSSLGDPHTRKAAHELLGSLYLAAGQIGEAGAIVEAGAQLPPDLPWPDPLWEEATAHRVGLKHSLERASSLLDAGQADEALAVLDSLARDHPDDPEVHYLKGWAYNQRQKPTDAERELLVHLRLSPASPKGHAQLAVALLAQRRFADAIPVLEAGLKLKPTWRELHANLGFACIQLNRAPEAEKHYRSALACDPNHVPTYTALAELLLRRGAQAEARGVLESAARLAPRDDRVLSLLQRAK